MPSLTDSKIKAAKPGPKLQKLSDGLGLALWITPAGDRGWRYQYRLDGKRTSVRLGTYPTMSLADARKAVLEARDKVAAGIDPSPTKAVPEATEDAPTTWGRFVDQWLAEEAPKISPLTLKKHRGQLRWMQPHLDKPVNQITPGDILDVLKAIEAAGYQNNAQQARGLYSRLFRLAQVYGHCIGNPADAVRGVTKPPVKRHLAGLTDPVEVGGLVRAIRGYQGEPSVWAALLTLAYTFLRQG